MAGRGPQTFKKRQKEQQRKEKQQEKAEKRMQRKQNKGDGGPEDGPAFELGSPEDRWAGFENDPVSH